MRWTFFIGIATVAACSSPARTSAPAPGTPDFATLCAEPPRKDRHGVEGCVMKDQRATIAIPIDTVRRPQAHSR